MQKMRSTYFPWIWMFVLLVCSKLINSHLLEQGDTDPARLPEPQDSEGAMIVSKIFDFLPGTSNRPVKNKKLSKGLVTNKTPQPTKDGKKSSSVSHGMWGRR